MMLGKKAMFSILLKFPMCSVSKYPQLELKKRDLKYFGGTDGWNFRGVH